MSSQDPLRGNSTDGGGRSRFALKTTRLVAPVMAKFLDKPQRHRRLQFEALGVSPHRVVFLGDSISEFGLWDEWFPNVPVLNRGIGGETSAQVLDRISTAIHEPVAVILLIGTNDLALGVPEADVLNNIHLILDEIEKRAPATPVWVQSVMPRTEKLLPELRSLNAGIQRIVDDLSDGVRYLDLWPVLATEKGTLPEEYSLDHLHLNGAGYQAWTSLLRESIPVLR
ncbi:GDSL-type esterase/lipase family protein (plasmid) [Arthrobacter sp. G.S.26]|uniref:GDSL-type esterase/lipase family protein n=1 Tax=Arthrobacter sp. G.S.26 TaxID=3433706 RepID=UPI003D771230